MAKKPRRKYQRDRGQKLKTEPDYIVAPNHGDSLTKVMATHPEGVSDKMICRALLLTQAELDTLFAGILVKLKDNLDPS